MAKCEVCGNDYDRSFEILMSGERHIFDSFECAVHALAPRCEACGVRIVGHGLQKGDKVFCCNACAEQKGVSELQDRA